MAQYELRVRPTSEDPREMLFAWKLLLTDKASGEGSLVVAQSGQHRVLETAMEVAGKALRTAVEGMQEPVRHEFECTCGAQLVVEARRSRKSPYSWDSLREVTCHCQRTYGVKLQFTTGIYAPRIELLPRG